MKKISPVIEKKIEDLVGYVNFDAIHFIDEEQVKFLGKVQRGKNQDYYFKIFDSFGYMFYNVILTKENNNFSFLCDCRKYKKMHCCEHIAASFYYYAHLFFDRTEDDLLVLSKSILKKYEPKEKKTKNRQEIHAEIELEFYKGHYNVLYKIPIQFRHGFLAYFLSFFLLVRIFLKWIYLVLINHLRYDQKINVHNNRKTLRYVHSNASFYIFGNHTEKKNCCFLSSKSHYKTYIQKNQKS